MYDDKDVERMLTNLLYEDTQRLLKMLAIYFSAKTKLQEVPVGSREWYIAVPPQTHISEYEPMHSNRPINVQKIVVPLIPFFGMFVGYNIEYDILFYWKG